MENIRNVTNFNINKYEVSEEDVIPLFLAGITIWRNVEKYEEDSLDEEYYTTLTEEDIADFISYQEYLEECDEFEDKDFKNYIKSLCFWCDSDKFRIEIDDNDIENRKEIINKIKLILSQ